MTIVRKVSSSRMRRIISTGTAAAPVTASRSDDRSNESRSGWSRIERYSVGGPGSTEMRSDATCASTAGTSNTGSGTMVAPWMKHATMPAL